MALRFRASSVLLAVLVFGRLPAVACDSCGCSVVPFSEKSVEKGFWFGIGEQFTDFSRLQTEGQPVSNDSNQYIHSSVTQFQFGYNFSDRIGVTLMLPYVDRSFNRVVGPFAGGASATETGNVSGLGDAILSGRYVLGRHVGHDYTMVTSISGGLKLPTGSPDELQSQVAAILGGPDSVVGGHDLALGTGSLDVILGAQFAYHRQSWLVDAVVQYSARNPGAFGYRYGNEFQWNVSVGRYLHSDAPSGRSTAAYLSVDGESKNDDVFGGDQLVVDTGAVSVFAGPKLTSSTGHGQFASIELSLPLHEYNTDTQLMPAYRLKGSYVLRF